MPAIITNKFRIHNAEQFRESFSEAAPNVYYLGIGRAQTWTTLLRGDGRTDYEGSDTLPILPSDTVATEFNTFDDLLAVKKITTANVAFVIPRNNWTTGTIYDIYRHDYGEFQTGSTTAKVVSTGNKTTLFDSLFYVLNSNFNVYKCLDNNNGAQSIVQPTGTNINTLETNDGYKWKYLYTLTAAEQTNFLSTDFMAVTENVNKGTGQSNVISAAVDGKIDIIKIKSPGSGGNNGTFTNIDIKGDGSAGKCSVTVAGGLITAVTVTTAGTGYTFGTVSNAQIVTAGSANLAGGELDVIIGPKGGHGANCKNELGAFFIMMNSNLEGAETANSGDFVATNDFREIVLIRDPKSGGSAATGATLRATYAVKINNPSGTFLPDEEITQTTTGAGGKVIAWDSVNAILYYIQTRHQDAGIDSNGNQVAFSGANVITGATSAVTGTPNVAQNSAVVNVDFSGGYSSPEIDHDTGDVVYVENRAPITRAADQTENVKLIIEF
jgi:hypothetical protein